MKATAQISVMITIFISILKSNSQSESVSIGQIIVIALMSTAVSILLVTCSEIYKMNKEMTSLNNDFLNSNPENMQEKSDGLDG